MDLCIGDGSIGKSNDVEDINIGIPSDLLLQSCGDPLDAILHSTYPNLLQNMDDPSFFQDNG